MKKILLLTFLGVFIFSCNKKAPEKTEKEKLEEMLTASASKMMHYYLPNEIIDSLYVAKVDSITEMHEQVFFMNYIHNRRKALLNRVENIMKDVTLYSAIKSSDLIELKKSEIDEISDSVNYYNKIFNKVSKKQCDSIKTLRYKAIVLINYHNENTNIAKKDSIPLMFNKKYQIIESKEYINQLISKFQ